jgi:hypothetical protein
MRTQVAIVQQILDSIEQRREQLESYLNELFSIEEIFNSQVI